ncbi:MAG: hypothetical protein JNK79_18340 [Chitinophagaceae bacterium]|nr:hypothetical protein [Chitinophagaceae bacterium]
MKKLFCLATIAFFLVACADSATDETTASDSTAATTETAPAATDTATAIKDGLMTMKDGKMMIAKNGAWEEMKEPVTTANGRTVAVNGEVSKGDKKRKLEEGQMIDADGQMMDKDGKLMDNTGW